MPATRAALDGRVALKSLDVIAIVWLTVLTRFQLASTALTVTLTAVPTICVVGVPVLPVEVPGAAVSPGIDTCNLLAVPALTVVPDPVLAVRFGDPLT